MTRQLTDRPRAVVEAKPAAAPRARWSARTRRDFLVFLAFAAPNILLIVAFTYRPLLSTTSTTPRSTGRSAPPPPGRRLRQLRAVLHPAPPTPEVLGTTAIFTVVTVGGSMLLGLLVALALNCKVRGAGFARSAVFAPTCCPGSGSACSGCSSSTPATA